MRREELENSYPEIRRARPDGDDGEHLQRSLGSLIVELTRELKDLFVTEVALARSEVSSKVEEATVGVASLMVGGAVCLAGLTALVASMAFAINDYALHEPWLSTLITGFSVIFLGLILLAVGAMRMRARKLAPKRSAENLREDVRVLKQEYERRI